MSSSQCGQLADYSALEGRLAPSADAGFMSPELVDRAVTQKCRPDWDITTPEMKAAWKEGRKELFYPYGKTYAQTLGEQD
jgi:hypothetical protein